MAYGMKGWVGLCVQDSFGTAVSVDSVSLRPFISESITETINPLVDEAMRSRFEEGETYEGAHEVGGDLVTDVHPNTLATLLYAWCGRLLYSEHSSGDTWKLEFRGVVSDWDELAAVPPFTIPIYRDAGSGFIYSDMCLSALALEFAHGAFLKATSTWVGGKYTKATLGAAATSDFPQNSDFTWDITSVSWGGVGVDEFVNLTVTFDNALEAKGTLDGTKWMANRIKRSGHRTITIAGTILFVNQTELDLWRAQTQKRLVITTAIDSYSLELDFPSVRYNEFPVNMGGPGLIEVSFAGVSKYNVGSGHNFNGFLYSGVMDADIAGRQDSSW